MATDFRAQRIRSNNLIVSRSDAGNASFTIYSGSSAADSVGGINDPQMFDGVGTDTFLFVSGTKSDVEGLKRGQRGSAVTLFGGDIVVSGTLYAERQVIEVDEVTTGSLMLSGGLFVSSSANINQGMVVNSSRGKTGADFFTVFNHPFEDGVRIRSDQYRLIWADPNKHRVFFLDDPDELDFDGGSPVSYTDAAVYYSGAMGSREEYGTYDHSRGVAVFGGDLHVSGTITFGDGTPGAATSAGAGEWTLTPDDDANGFNDVLYPTNNPETVSINSSTPLKDPQLQPQENKADLYVSGSVTRLEQIEDNSYGYMIEHFKARKDLSNSENTAVRLDALDGDIIGTHSYRVWEVEQYGAPSVLVNAIVDGRYEPGGGGPALVAGPSYDFTLGHLMGMVRNDGATADSYGDIPIQAEEAIGAGDISFSLTSVGQTQIDGGLNFNDPSSTTGQPHVGHIVSAIHMTNAGNTNFSAVQPKLGAGGPFVVIMTAPGQYEVRFLDTGSGMCGFQLALNLPLGASVTGVTGVWFGSGSSWIIDWNSSGAIIAFTTAGDFDSLQASSSTYPGTDVLFTFTIDDTSTDFSSTLGPLSYYVGESGTGDFAECDLDLSVGNSGTWANDWVNGPQTWPLDYQLTVDTYTLDYTTLQPFYGVHFQFDLPDGVVFIDADDSGGDAGNAGWATTAGQPQSTVVSFTSTANPIASTSGTLLKVHFQNVSVDDPTIQNSMAIGQPSNGSYANSELNTDFIDDDTLDSSDIGVGVQILHSAPSFNTSYSGGYSLPITMGHIASSVLNIMNGSPGTIDQMPAANRLNSSDYNGGTELELWLEMYDTGSAPNYYPTYAVKYNSQKDICQVHILFDVSQTSASLISAQITHGSWTGDWTEALNTHPNGSVMGIDFNSPTNAVPAGSGDLFYVTFDTPITPTVPDQFVPLTGLIIADYIVSLESNGIINCSELNVDVNGDGSLNITDVVSMSTNLLANPDFNTSYPPCGDQGALTGGRWQVKVRERGKWLQEHWNTIDARSFGFVAFHSGSTSGPTSPDEAWFTDTNFFVSGTINSSDGCEGSRGTALFGGDVKVSGSLRLNTFMYPNNPGCPDIPPGQVAIFAGDDTETGGGVGLYGKIGGQVFNLGGSSTPQAKIQDGNAVVQTSDDGANSKIEFYVDPDGTGSKKVWEIDSQGRLVPGEDAALDIGEPTKIVRDLYVSLNSIKFVDDQRQEFNLSIDASTKRAKYRGNTLAYSSEVGNNFTVDGTSGSTIDINSAGDSITFLNGGRILSVTDGSKDTVSLQLENGTEAGQIMMWDGSSWVLVLNPANAFAIIDNDGDQLVVTSGDNVPILGKNGIKTDVRVMKSGDALEINLDASSENLTDMPDHNTLVDGESLVWDSKNQIWRAIDFSSAFIGTINLIAEDSSSYLLNSANDSVEFIGLGGIDTAFSTKDPNHLEITLNAALTDLNDVTGTPTVGQTLIYDDKDGGNWKPGDVAPGGLTSWTYSTDDAGSGTINSDSNNLDISGGAGISTSTTASTVNIALNAGLNNLGDVDTTGQSEGTALVYDANAKLWKPQTISASSAMESRCYSPEGPDKFFGQSVLVTGIGTPSDYLAYPYEKGDIANQNEISYNAGDDGKGSITTTPWTELGKGVIFRAAGQSSGERRNASAAMFRCDIPANAKYIRYEVVASPFNVPNIGGTNPPDTASISLVWAARLINPNNAPGNASGASATSATFEWTDPSTPNAMNPSSACPGWIPYVSSLNSILPLTTLKTAPFTWQTAVWESGWFAIEDSVNSADRAFANAETGLTNRTVDICFARASAGTGAQNPVSLLKKPGSLSDTNDFDVVIHNIRVFFAENDSSMKG